MADTITSTIEKFYEVAQSRDFSRDINFRLLSISLGDGSTVKFDEDDLVYAKGAQLPSRKINMQQVQFLGLAFNIPGTVSYEGSADYPIRFYADMNSILRDKLEQATRDVFDDANSTGNYFTPKASAVIDLVQLNAKNEVIKHYKLIGVAVHSVDSIDYGYAEGNGKVQEITAHISFHFYQTS